MSETVLCLNAGSSSIKFKLYARQGAELSAGLEGQFEGFGAKPRLEAEDGGGKQLVNQDFSAEDIPDTNAAVPKMMSWLGEQLQGELPVAIGHRLVLGGTRYSAPTLIDDEAIQYLHAISQLAPLHLPGQMVPIEAIRQALPDIPQVAVFDTGFHRGHADVFERLPIPWELHDEGVQRYGYHGSSYDYIAHCLPDIAPEIAGGRVVVAHLGSGASMAVLVNGKSHDTSMGFSALEGLPMGTRPGRLDAGVVQYLYQVKGMSSAEVDKLLYKQCGLLGISGVSNDVRELLASDDPNARLALDYFTLSCAQAAAQLAVSAGGIDGLVFTAGIGERSAVIRGEICAQLGFLFGIELDQAANEANKQQISSSNSKLPVFVLPTNEELMIARHAIAVVAGN